MLHNKHAIATSGLMFPKWETSPLFLYDEPESESETSAIIAASGSDVFETLPFPVFRIDITVGEKNKPKDWGKYKAKAVCAIWPEGIAVLARVDSLMHNAATYSSGRFNPDKALPLNMIVTNIKQSRPGSSDFLCDSNVMGGLAGQWFAGSPPDFFRSYINGVLKSLAAFNLSAMSHTNHIARVHPDQPNRSVEWKQARTHYTLITHGHPANNPGVTHGERVVSDPGQELTRIAHNRRAHKRTLRAARFRYARGKTINVKATWVGPKEWKDAGGHQIYRILEPVDGTGEIAA